MSDLGELYQQVILDHNKRPRNFRRLEEANHRADGHNPLCGDQLTVYLQMEGDVIRDIAFHGAGCAISKASASLMTESVKGKTKLEAEQIFEKMHKLLTGDPCALVETGGLGKLAVFSGVCEFPVRVKCASLAWHTLRAALEQIKEAVSTE
ncbi:MAG: SUF system NifU family Fe-S cluster assembly protein [Acidobacteria bacterium]|nr:SUF system NifU family Fe-S cluster assembly protein [Acidobacteriota bacterium]MBI3656622.1 SUF system NifU family Fe-S cluster assembly protein [Acidobacteriota bacterium]